jgi:hypothetical protein
LFEEVEKAPTRASINRDVVTIEALVIIAFIPGSPCRTFLRRYAEDSPSVCFDKPAPKVASLDRALP